MQYLDYNRLIECTDVQLRRLLVTVCNIDTKRRCRAAFPEFFDHVALQTTIAWQDLVDRYQAVSESEVSDWDDDLNECFNWFGIKTEQFEYRVDGITQKDSRLLPADFTLERDDSYDGMTSSDRWLIQIPKAVPNKFATHEEYLVLGNTTTGESNSKFFLWAVPTLDINFN